MKATPLLAGVLLLTASHLGARGAIKMHVSPAVSAAPATVRILFSIEPDPENRALAVIVESPDYFRSSEVALEGDRAPRADVIEYRSLPAGTYEVRGVLVGASGRERAVARGAITVIGQP